MTRCLPTVSLLLAAAALAACSTTNTAAPNVAAPRGVTMIKTQPLGRNPLAWPALTETNKPWTRWWWMGSAVTKAEISRQMELLKNAGEGGVEICPIYGVVGNEPNDIPFLSAKWVDMLAHTTTEGKRLEFGVDMTTGTGWPFGGPMVSPDIASSSVQMRRYDVASGSQITGELPKGKIQFVGAQGPDGKMTDITASAHDGKIDWTAPAGASWKVYVVAQQDAIQKVKRPAPGGEGNVLDPYSADAMAQYLATFDKAFAAAGFAAPRPRSEFHDSFEYYGANWTDDFFSEFQKRRGYDLRTQIPALMGEKDVDPETAARVKCDYRETLADLHLAYMHRWVEWAHSHGELTRNQAHGSPANILDAYAVSDIPECEIFHLYEESHIPFLKLANSAAHVTGKRLASSESYTWLGDHFNVSLADVKAPTDFLFITGINHIFFHGTPYSPAAAAFPGYNFYASVNFGPNGGMFRDIGAMNAYIARCQSILQANKPGNDVLLYMPFYEIWQHQLSETRLGSGQDPATLQQSLMFQFTTPGEWMKPFPFYATAMDLFKKGYAYDEVSDALLNDARGGSGGIELGGNTYKTIIVPETPILPVETMRKLADLSRAGAKVIFLGKPPTDVPGFNNVAARRAELAALVKGVEGKVIAGDASNLESLLTQAGATRERMIDQGLRCIRRFRPDGVDYFIVNKGENAVDGWVPLATPAAGAVLMDPMVSDQVGTASVRERDGGAEIYLQIAPGESRIVRTTTGRAPAGAAWTYVTPAGQAVPLKSDWQVTFADGGPDMPANFKTDALGSFTGRGEAYKRFAGTAVYTTTFDAPSTQAKDYSLDLGQVGDSARVTLNGKELGTLWAAPFRIRVGDALKPGSNTLKIEVTNIAANRIADMDRRGIKWKIFKDINVVNIKAGTAGTYVPMDASTYAERPAGLIGPVELVPLAAKDVNR
jgi:hypothetical protein